MAFVGTKLAAVGDDNANGRKKQRKYFRSNLCPIWHFVSHLTSHFPGCVPIKRLRTPSQAIRLDQLVWIWRWHIFICSDIHHLNRMPSTFNLVSLHFYCFSCFLIFSLGFHSLACIMCMYVDHLISWQYFEWRLKRINRCLAASITSHHPPTLDSIAVSLFTKRETAMQSTPPTQMTFLRLPLCLVLLALALDLLPPAEACFTCNTSGRRKREAASGLLAIDQN